MMTQTGKRIIEIVEELTEDEQRQLLWQAIQMREAEEAEPGDMEAIAQANAEFARGEYVRHDEIDWN